MKTSLVIVRIFETIALAGIVYTLTYSAGSVKANLSVISLNFNTNIASHSDFITLSSAIFGFALSLIGTSMQNPKHEPKLRKISIILALLGGLGYSNEFFRFLNGHAWQILISLPAPLMIIDLIMLRRIKRQTSAQTTPETTDLNTESF
jgi:hypothetical protein